MKALGRLEQSQEIQNDRLNKLESWKDGRLKRTWLAVGGVSAITVALMKAAEFVFGHAGGK